MKKPPKIEVTKDYSRFVLSDFNRDVTTVKELTASMKKHGCLSRFPIWVELNAEGKLVIRDGHHRFEVACALGLPIYYIVCEPGVRPAEAAMAMKSWTQADYLQAHGRSGLADYRYVEAFQKRTGIPLSSCIALLAGDTATSASSQTRRFKAGLYVVGDTDHAEAVAEVVKYCVAMGAACAQKDNFVKAVSRCLRCDKFELGTFLARVEANGGAMMVPQHSVDAYMDLIERIYNFRAPADRKLAVKFEVGLAMQKRRAAQRRKRPGEEEQGEEAQAPLKADN